MNARRLVGTIVGGILVAVLLAFLSEPVFEVARSIVVLASGALLLLLAGALFLRPARRALGAIFAFDVPEGAAFAVATERELEQLREPLLTALVLLGVAGVATLIR